ncbi:40S ribosomal protein S5-1 [Hordeum vulgare]|nr:40S ribosomal protein S5-1 [Hordeum vulgare]
MPEPPVEYQTPVYQWEPEELTQQWHPQSAPEYPGAAPKDKIFEKVINPYLAEVLQHPQSIKMSEGMLHIRDVEGPKKIGSMEMRLEAMQQQVFKCQGMVERGLNANHMMITKFTNNHKMDAIDIGKRSMTGLINSRARSMTCRTKTVSMNIDLNQYG